MNTLDIEFPTTLRLRARTEDALHDRSRCPRALKYFELGELSSGQAARMCGLGRVAFLSLAANEGAPAVDLSDEELEREFAED